MLHKGVRPAPEGRAAGHDAAPRRHPEDEHAEPLTQEDTGEADLPDPAARRTGRSWRTPAGPTSPTSSATTRPGTASTCSSSAASSRMVARLVNQTHPDVREPRPAGVDREAVPLRAGHGAPGRRDRVRQVHHHRVDARLHELTGAAAHPDHRGPDRVRVPDKMVDHEPAGDRPGRVGLAHGPEARGPRGPGRDPGGRDAGHRDVRGGRPRGRDRARGVRDDPRLQRRSPRSTASSTCSRRTSTTPSGRRWRST